MIALRIFMHNRLTSEKPKCQLCIKCINYASIKTYCNFFYLAKMAFKIKLEFIFCANYYKIY